MIELSFTHYWDEERIEEAKPLVREVLEDLPQLPYDELRIGTTGTAHGRFQRQRDHTHDIYIQLNPQELSKFTIAHELHHHLTRERVIDLRTIAMGEEYHDSEPFYLQEVEGCGDLTYMMEKKPGLISHWAREALNQEDIDPVKYFQNRMKERSKLPNFEGLE
jgi:hypothetical protein